MNVTDETLEELEELEKRRVLPAYYYPTWVSPYYPRPEIYPPIRRRVPRNYYPVPFYPRFPRGYYPAIYPAFPHIAVLKGEFEEIVSLLDKLIAAEKNEKTKEMYQEVRTKILDLLKVRKAEYQFVNDEDEEIALEVIELIEPQEITEIMTLLDKLIANAETNQERNMVREIKAKISRLVGGIYPYPYPYPRPCSCSEERGFNMITELTNELIFDEKGRQQIEILRVGEWDHPVHGRISITLEDLQNMVENFESGVIAKELPVNCAHETKPGAVGWIKEIFLQDKILNGWVEWTPEGKEKLENKTYKYISAEFEKNYIDPETKAEHGATLVGAALTIRPMVKDLAPVAMSQDAVADLETLWNSLIQLEEKITEVLKGQPGKKSLLEMAKQMKELIGKKIGKKIEKCEETAETKSLKERIQNLETELRESKIKEKVAKLEGKIPMNLMKELETLYLSIDATIEPQIDSFLEKLPNYSKLFTEIGFSGNSEEVTDLDSIAKKIMKTENKNYREAIQMAIERNPNLYEDYRNKFKKLSLDEENLQLGGR